MNTEHLTESPSLEGSDVSLLDLIRVFVDNLRLLVLGPILVGAVVTASVYLLITPYYTSSVKFITPPPPQSVGAGALSALGFQGFGGGGGFGASLRNPTDIYLAFMTSNRLRDVVIEKFNLKDKFPGKSKDEIRAAVGAQAEVKIGRDGIITVEVTDKSPQRAAEMANLYPFLLQEMMTEYGVTEANARKAFLKKQVDQMRISIRAQEAELKQTGMNVDMLKLDMSSSVAEMANLKSAITSQEIRLRSLSSYLASTAPDYKLAQSELVSLRVQLQNVENSHKKQPGSSSYPEKYRSYLYDLQLLENLIKQSELAQIDANKEDMWIQVMDPAEPASRKSGPSYRNALIISVLVSGFILLVWVYFRFGLQRAQTHHPDLRNKIEHLGESWRKVWRLPFFSKRKAQ